MVEPCLASGGSGQQAEVGAVEANGVELVEVAGHFSSITACCSKEDLLFSQADNRVHHPLAGGQSCLDAACCPVEQIKVSPARPVRPPEHCVSTWQDLHVLAPLSERTCGASPRY